MLYGINIQILVKTPNGVDAFNRPIYSEDWETVEDVLVAPASSDDVVNELSMSGKRISYTIAIPKGDAHEWTNTLVRFGGETFETVGIPMEGIEANIPLRWNAKISVARYE